MHYAEAYYSIPHIASFFLLSSEDHTLMAECTVPSHQLTLTSVFHTFTAWDEQSYTRRSLQLAFRSHSPGCAWNVCSHFSSEERGVTRLHNARSSRIFLMLIHAIKECRLIINRPTIHQSSHVSQTRSDDAVKVGQNLLRHVDPHKVMRKRHSLPLKTHFNCCFIFRLTV